MRRGITMSRSLGPDRPWSRRLSVRVRNGLRGRRRVGKRLLMNGGDGGHHRLSGFSARDVTGVQD